MPFMRVGLSEVFLIKLFESIGTGVCLSGTVGYVALSSSDSKDGLTWQRSGWRRRSNATWKHWVSRCECNPWDVRAGDSQEKRSMRFADATPRGSDNFSMLPSCCWQTSNHPLCGGAFPTPQPPSQHLSGWDCLETRKGGFVHDTV